MTPLAEFTLAFAIFLLAHAIPSQQRVRGVLVSVLGERSYQVLYSLVSVVLLAWLILAATRAPVIALWQQQAWQARLALVFASFGLWLTIAGAIVANPLSISLIHGCDPAYRPAVLTLTRHPILWGLALWALAHALAHGDLVRLLMFGGLGLFALFGTILTDRRKQHRFGMVQWLDSTTGTSNVPGVALVLGLTRPRLDAALALAGVLAGVLTFGLLAGWHVMLFGADPLTAAHWLR